MKQKIGTVINTKHGGRVTVSGWPEGGVWLYLAGWSANMSMALTRDEAQALVAGMQEILAKEVAA